MKGCMLQMLVSVFGLCTLEHRLSSGDSYTSKCLLCSCGMSYLEYSVSGGEMSALGNGLSIMACIL